MPELTLLPDLPAFLNQATHFRKIDTDLFLFGSESDPAYVVSVQDLAAVDPRLPDIALDRAEFDVDDNGMCRVSVLTDSLIYWDYTPPVSFPGVALLDGPVISIFSLEYDQGFRILYEYFQVSYLDSGISMAQRCVHGHVRLSDAVFESVFPGAKARLLLLESFGHDAHEMAHLVLDDYMPGATKSAAGMVELPQFTCGDNS